MNFQNIMLSNLFRKDFQEWPSATQHLYLIKLQIWYRNYAFGLMTC